MMRVKFVIASVSAAALAMSALALTGQTAHAIDAPAPKANSCLQVPKSKAWENVAPIKVVSCDALHNSEAYKVIPYPANLGAPSTIADRTWELFGSKCTYEGFEEWLGTTKFRVPVRVYRIFRLPTDEQWKAGARWVACTAMALDKNGDARSVKGTLPSLLKSTPLIDWLACLGGTPKSGEWNPTTSCTSKSKWLMIIGIQVEGPIGPDYPKDVQAEADALCAESAKGLLKKGAKTKPVAGLGPKSDFPDGDPFAECFIAMADWTGKAS